VLVNGALYQRITAPFIVGSLRTGALVRGQYALRGVVPAGGYVLTYADLQNLVATDATIRAVYFLSIETEGAYLYSMEDFLQTHLRDWFLPGSGDLLPGPYKDPKAMVDVFVMDGPAPAIRDVLPRGLWPVPGPAGNRYFLCFNHFTAMATEHPTGLKGGLPVKFDYLEALVFLPCLRGAQFGLYCASIYPDNMLAILIGREVHGLPKRFGVVRDFEGGPHTLLVDGQECVRASWGSIEVLDRVSNFLPSYLDAFLGGEPGVSVMQSAVTALGTRMDDVLHHWCWPFLPVFTRRRVPAMTDQIDIDYTIDQLVSVPFKGRVQSVVRLVDPSVTVEHQPFPVIGGTCRGAWRLAVGLEVLEPRIRADRNHLRWFLPPFSWAEEAEEAADSGARWLSEVAQRRLSTWWRER